MGVFSAILGPLGAVIDIGLGIGLSYYSNKIEAKKAARRAARGTGIQDSLQLSADAPRTVIFGTRDTPGDLAYWQLYGTDNKSLDMVIALASHECDSLVGVYVDGVYKTIDALTKQVQDFGPNLLIEFYSGAPGQAAAASVVANSGGRWTANEVGAYTCYAVVRAIYKPSVFPSGRIPRITFVVKGAKLYDPRFDTTAGGSGSQRWADQTTWAYSANCAVAAYNVIRGFSAGGKKLIGMSAPASAIRFSDYVAAANACDESVLNKAGQSEARYALGARFNSRQDSRAILASIKSAMAGAIIMTGGIYRIMAGVAQSPVAYLNDTALVLDEPFTDDSKRSRSELVNTIEAKFTDTSKGWQELPAPARTSSADQTTDGGVNGPIRLVKELSLESVTSRTQAQRVMEIERKRARRQRILQMTVKRRWFVLEPGDWITFQSDRRSLAAGTYEVLQRRVRLDLTTELVLGEVDDQIDDYDPQVDEIADGASADLLAAGPTLSVVTVLELENALIVSDGAAQTPGLTITWTPITDPTVQSLDLEFRRVGDTAAMSLSIREPDSGTYTWATGVLGGTQYEARLRPRVLPARFVDWSAWFATAVNSAPQIVDVAAVATTVPDDSITPAKLSAQARLELSLVTGTEAVQGSVQEQINEAIRIARQAAASAMGVALSNTRLIRAVQATSNGNTIAITETLEAVGSAEALAARWSLDINVNGHITGYVSLSGSATSTQFAVVVDNFAIARFDGSEVKQIFTTGLVNGVDQIAIDADQVLIDGSVKVRHLDAIDIATLYISDPDNTYYYDFANGRQGTTDGLFTIDSAQGEINIIAPQPLDFRYGVNSGYLLPVMY